jgi:phosphatidylserine decarboxylase
MKFCFYNVLPTRTLSRIFGAIMRCRVSVIKNFMIKVYVKIYKIDLAEYEFKNIKDYPSLDDFFIRRLAASARELNKNPGEIISPVDGKVMELGIMQGKRCLQVKGIPYQLEDLLGGDDFLAQHYADGLFANFYLAPHNYHRVHMPIDGELQHMTYIPGPLLPVKPSIINKVPGVLAGNERLVCEFSTACGTMLVVLVGAFFVGNIEVSWHKGEIVNAKHPAKINHWNYANDAIVLKQGDEIGCFHMGSSVVLAFNGSMMAWRADLEAGMPVKYTESIANFTSAATA